MSKWQSIVKANREAPTLRFATGNEDVPRTSTTGALIAKFTPTQDFEKDIASMLEAAGAHNEQAVQEAEEALALKVSRLPSLCCASEMSTLSASTSFLTHSKTKLEVLELQYRTWTWERGHGPECVIYTTRY